MELALLIDKQRLLTHGPVSLLGKCIKESKRRLRLESLRSILASYITLVR